MAARTITIRGLPDATLAALRKSAARNRRSLNAELLTVLDAASEASRRAGSASILRERVVAPARSRASLPERVNRVELAEVCRRFHIRSLALFGSAARGEDRPESDVDLLADFEPGMTPGFGIVTVADALSRVFGKPVDLVTPRGLAPGLRDRITREKVPLYHA